MAERFNATVLKTVVAQVTLSSNLSPSAMNNNQSQATEIFFVKRKTPLSWIHENIYSELCGGIYSHASSRCVLALFCDFSCLQASNRASPRFSARFIRRLNLLYTLYPWLYCLCCIASSPFWSFSSICVFLWSPLRSYSLCDIWSHEPGPSPWLVVAGDYHRSCLGLSLDGHRLLCIVSFYSLFSLTCRKFFKYTFRYPV